MDLDEFNLNTIDQRIQLIEDQGIYLTMRMEGNNNVFLFYLNTFFAEIWYGPKYNQIMQVRSFINQNNLDPYVELVDLRELN